MQKTRNLVGAIPKVKAPESIVEQIKEQLERRTLVGSSVDEYDEIEGAKHLLGRRLLSAAAVIVLFIALSIIVYTIMAPAGNDDKMIASNNWLTEDIDTVVKTKSAEPAAPKTAKVEKTEIVKPQPERFSGRLELLTSQFIGVDAYVKRSILDSGVVLVELPMANKQKGQYQLRCDHKVLNNFLTDLNAIDDKIDSTRLRLFDKQSGIDIVVNDVTAEQINAIATQADMQESLKLAKSTAAINDMVTDLRAAEMLLETPDVNIESLSIPKPVLTSNDITIKTTPVADANEIIELIIKVKQVE